MAGVASPGWSKRARRSPRSVALTPTTLEAAALRYLNRFDCTRQRLREVLERKVAKARREQASDEQPSQDVADAEPVEQWIEQLLNRLSDAGYLNDARYAQALA